MSEGDGRGREKVAGREKAAGGRRPLGYSSVHPPAATPAAEPALHLRLGSAPAVEQQSAVCSSASSLRSPHLLVRLESPPPSAVRPSTAAHPPRVCASAWYVPCLLSVSTLHALLLCSAFALNIVCSCSAALLLI
jgi:hypothetical protein